MEARAEPAGREAVWLNQPDRAEGESWDDSCAWPPAGGLKAEIRFRDVLFLAPAAGAFTAFLEGAGLYAFQADRWVGRGFLGTTATLPILYLSPLFNLLFFGGAALLLQGVFLALRIAAEAHARLILGAMCFLAVLDWLAFSERFTLWSAIVLALGLAAATARWLGRDGQRTLCRSAGKIFAAFAAAIALLALGIVPTQRQAERAARAALPPPPAGAPNIVLLILDTTRADHMSVYGYGRKTTPFLEHLAAEGTVFDNAVATSSWTLPSHVSMLTGRYPREHGAVLNAYDGRYPSVASSFDRLGYLTAGVFGKPGLVCLRARHGRRLPAL
jgi:hypothetical protein